jgi:hypothetical protein
VIFSAQNAIGQGRGDGVHRFVLHDHSSIGVACRLPMVRRRAMGVKSLAAASFAAGMTALSACGATRPMDQAERIGDRQLRAMTADFSAAQHGVAPQ